jgi:plastocyanin
MMHYMRATTAAFSAVGIFVMASHGAAHMAPKGDAEKGKELYQRYCVQCHGDRADGNGEAANWTTPRPRDFRQGLFKFRSTPLGSLPTDQDLYKTVSNGLYGTSMPPFEAINPRARKDLVAYVESISGKWVNAPEPTPIEIPAETPNTAESAVRGHDQFVKLCSSCHGDGTGNGPLSKSLVDAWGEPIKPANFTIGRTKQAVVGKDIYRTFMTGINGTPMPGFKGTISDPDAWDLVHFVESLGPWKESTKETRAATAQWSPDLLARGNGQNPAAAANVSGGTTAPATGATVSVKMIGDAKGYRFEPSTITVKAGDAVSFTNVAGGPHNITFWADSIPSGTAPQLQANMPNTTGPLTSPLFVTADQVYTISTAKLKPGTYKFYCMPHLALGMHGELVVQ